MTTYGLTSTGFLAKTMENILDDMRAEFRARFSPSFPLGDGEFVGQATQIISEAIALVWELAESINSAMDPDAATGAQLDALCALTGTVRDPARPSTCPVYLTGTPGTIVPAGSVARPATATNYSGPLAEFETDAEVTIAAATAWLPSTAYAVGDIRTNAARIYIVTDAGTSAVSGGPDTTSDAIIDGGSLVWAYLGAGTGYVTATMTAVEPGAAEATARDLTEIRTPIAGWSGVINVEDATIGNPIQTDADLRIARADELAGAGTGTVDAIRAAVLRVTGVTSCRVFSNNLDATDVDGVPPHAIEVLVVGGSDQAIADALLDNVALGIGYHGTTTQTATDSYGTDHTIKFSRPTPVPIYVEITLVKDAATYPATGDTLVKDAIVAYADEVAVGRNAVSSLIGAQAFSVTGVLEVTTTFIKTSAGPTLPTTITITDRQILTIIAGNISVVSSSGTV